MILTESIRNLARAPRRSTTTALTLAGSTVLIVILLALQEGTYRTLLATVLGNSVGSAQISKTGFEPDRNFDHLFDPIQILADLDGRVAAAPRLQAQVLLSTKGRSVGAQLVAIDSAREVTIGLWQASIQGGLPSTSDTVSAVVGVALARALGVSVGDSVDVLAQGTEGQLASGSLVVRSVLATGVDEVDRSFVLCSFAAADALFGSGPLAHVIVLGFKGDPWNAQADLRSLEVNLPIGLEAKPWQSILPDLFQAIRLDRASNLIFYLTLILVVALSASNAWLLTLHERRRVHGILVAIGAPRSRLWMVLMGEILMLSLVAVAMGILLAVPLLMWMNIEGVAVPGSEMFARWGLPPRLHPAIDPSNFLMPGLLVGSLAIVTGGLCTLGVFRAHPQDGLRP